MKEKMMKDKVMVCMDEKERRMKWWGKNIRVEIEKCERKR